MGADRQPGAACGVGDGVIAAALVHALIRLVVFQKWPSDGVSEAAVWIAAVTVTGLYLWNRRAAAKSD